MDNIKEFITNNFLNKRYLALDIGMKNIGVAITDKNNLVAIPLTTFDTKDIEKKFLNFIKEYQIYGIIVGKPYNFDGSDSIIFQEIQKIFNIMNKKANFPHIYLDERLTSKDFKKNTNKSSKISIHEKSACLILNDFLSVIGNAKKN